ncbi:AAA family ATPase [Plesiomonas shigelloides]|uniref:AAA family ATPase n=1 Tax=Plesiomonas shigelloides TaxID=703 RepID=UPI00211783F9|nr:AAA family ATPase [Plesiomonas shigelloides]MCQ8859421.1 AAA family ATPase [Plesiomonas shigelloides]
MENIQQRLKTLQQELQTGLVGRTQAVKIALLALLAEENVLLVGPPGTAKSLLARKIAQSIQSSEEKGTVPYFEYLLTKFSTPEEIFGPLSISELKKDCFKRNTLGYLPSAQVGFLDEIFKASSSILNSLLTIMNEKLYHNGTTVVPTPLRSLIAASNELPSGQEELEALYDRFLLRQYVGYVADNDISKLINVIASSQNSAVKPLSPYELAKIKELSAHVKLPEQIMQVLKDIWLKHRDAFKEDCRESLSDRRLVKVVNILKVSAATNGRSDVDLSDVFLLIHCLWNHPDNAGKVKDIIFGVIRYYTQKINDKRAWQSNRVNRKLNMKERSVSERKIKKTHDMKGSGSEYDPFIVSDAEDLMLLAREEIGRGNYYFSQKSNIDLSSLSHYEEIIFKGVYRGNGKTITCRNSGAVFSAFKKGSQCSGVCIKNGSLAITAYGTSFFAITADAWIISSVADKCDFNACCSGKSLIKKRVSNCKLQSCLSKGPIVSSEVESTNSHNKSNSTADMYNVKLFDSVIDLSGVDKIPLGCVSSNGIDGLEIRNLFIFSNSITINDRLNPVYMTGVSPKASPCSISGCVVGELNLTSKNVANFYISNLFKDCSVNKGERSKYSLSNNYVSVSTSKYKINGCGSMNNNNGFGGGVMGEEQFKKTFFEKTLGWDFDSIWQWNAQHNRPELQRVGVDALNKISRSFENEQSQTPLPVLDDELKQNIWL